MEYALNGNLYEKIETEGRLTNELSATVSSLYASNTPNPFPKDPHNLNLISQVCSSGDQCSHLSAIIEHSTQACIFCVCGPSGTLFLKIEFLVSFCSSFQ
jgi:hypothetical protein